MAEGFKISLWRHGGISGTVTDERGEPLVGVLVRVFARIHVAGVAQLASGPVAVTDNRGRYRIGRLQAGSYLVCVPNVHMSVPASTPAVFLGGASGQTVGMLEAAGRPTPRPDATVVSTENTRVLAGPYPRPLPRADGQLRRYPITFAGGATSPEQATPIHLDAAAELTDVDVRLIAVPAVRVHGRLEGPANTTTERTVRLLAAGMEELGVGSETATALVLADTSFTFDAVPAGHYTLDVPASISEYSVASPFEIAGYTSLPRLPGLSVLSATFGSPSGLTGVSASHLEISKSLPARVPVVVEGPTPAPLVVRLDPLPTVRGRIELDLDPAHPFAPEAVRFIWLDPANGSARLGAQRNLRQLPSPAGEFAVSAIPGAYLFRSSETALTIKSVRCGSVDCTHRPFDIAADESNIVVTFTNAGAALTGTVRMESGSPASGVLVFPQEPAQWSNYGTSPARIRFITAGAAGSFRITSLPAGEYFAIALPVSQQGRWSDPDYLRRAAARAARVTARWGETTTQELVVVDVR